MARENSPSSDGFAAARPPIPSHNRHLAELSGKLRSAASDSARSALHNYAHDDTGPRRDAAVAAGTATEYLVRAALAAHDPVLLADRQTPSSVIALSRANVATPLDVRKLKTVGVMQAAEMLHAIHPIPKLLTDVKLIMDVRNSAAHLALVDEHLLAEAAVNLVRVAGALLNALGLDEDAFWGRELSSVVATMKDEYATAITRRLQAKLAHARSELERMVDSLSKEDRERALQVLENRTVQWMAADDHIDRPETCPACDRQGQATYWKEQGTDFDEEVDYDRDGTPEAVYYTVDVYFTFGMFQCPVCNLHLEQGEEVGTDIPSELDPEREVTDSPYEHWEPDEDWMRGR